MDLPGVDEVAEVDHTHDGTARLVNQHVLLRVRGRVRVRVRARARVGVGARVRVRVR